MNAAHYFYGGEHDGKEVVTTGCLPYLVMAVWPPMTAEYEADPEAPMPMPVQYWHHRILRHNGKDRHVYVRPGLYEGLVRE